MSDSGLRRTGLVVVVDDDAPVRTFLDVLLSRRGHRVMTAGGVADGFALCRDVPADVVIVDMVLPPGNALPLIAALRTRDRRPKVFAISGAVSWAAPIYCTRPRKPAPMSPCASPCLVIASWRSWSRSWTSLP